MLNLRPSFILRNVHVTHNPSVNKLLPVVGDLQSARNEFRWLLEDCQKRLPGAQQHAALTDLVERRSRGEPLQYLLGSTYFGDLEIKCRSGVFIPRPETAAAVSYLVQSLFSWSAGRSNAALPKAQVGDSTGNASKPNTNVAHKLQLRGLASRSKALRVFDLCSGSGCIPLLFWHEYYKLAAERQVNVPNLEIFGFDMSPDALELARENLMSLKMQRSMRGTNKQALQSLKGMKFMQANVLRSNSSTPELAQLNTLRQAVGERVRQRSGKKYISQSVLNNDIWISNPPYISPESYVKSTEKSVRDFEPKAALVPPLTHETKLQTRPLTGNDGDRFHQDLLEQAKQMRVKVILLEVEDLDQAIRVASLAVSQNHWYTYEIWRDEPAAKQPIQYRVVGDKVVSIYGAGEGRSVLLCNRYGAELLDRHPPQQEHLDADVLELLNIAKLNKRITALRNGLEGGKKLTSEERAQHEKELRTLIHQKGKSQAIDAEEAAFLSTGSFQLRKHGTQDISIRMYRPLQDSKESNTNMGNSQSPPKLVAGLLTPAEHPNEEVGSDQKIDTVDPATGATSFLDNLDQSTILARKQRNERRWVRRSQRKA